MDLEPTDDQLAMAAGLARLCADLVTPEAAGPRSPCRAPWTGTCGAPSATSAPSPSPSPGQGGLGLGLAEATLVFEELGKAAVPGPLVGTFLAAGLPRGGGRRGRAGHGRRGGGRPGARARPYLVEHRAALDALLVVGPAGLSLVGRPGAGARWTGPSIR